MSRERHDAELRETERQANRAIVAIIVVAVVAILLFWLVGYEAIFG